MKGIVFHLSPASLGVIYISVAAKATKASYPYSFISKMGGIDMPYWRASRERLHAGLRVTFPDMTVVQGWWIVNIHVPAYA